MSRQGIDDEKRERIEAARARGCNGRDDVVEGEMIPRKDCREGQDVEKFPSSCISCWATVATV